MNAVKVCSLLVTATALLAGCSTTPTPSTTEPSTLAPVTTPTTTTTTPTTTAPVTPVVVAPVTPVSATLSLDPATRTRLVQQLSQMDSAARAQVLQSQQFGNANATTEQRTQFLTEQGLIHLDPASALAKQRSVFFDFDKFVIRDADAAVVQLHGPYLAKNASLTVKVEGNADERGSKEYNLSLGQKRAEAVVRALKALGVKDTQAEPVSFGEDKPQATGHDEAAWSQNRRADINYGLK